MIHPVPKPKPKRGAKAAKQRAKFQREYGGVTRLTWLKAWVCRARLHPHLDCSGPIEAAHTASGGVGRKADASTLIPLCRKHHAELHQYGAHSFEKAYGLSLRHEAEKVDNEWQRHLAGQ